MTGSLSDYAETQILRFLFSGAAVTRPISWWVVLHSNSPGESGTGSQMTAYGRKYVTFAAPDSASKVLSEAQVSFPPDTDPATMSTLIKQWSVWTASTGGQCLGWGDLGQQIVASKLAPFPAGDLWIQARGLSSYGRGLALNWLFRAAAITRPTAWWLGFHTSTPNEDGVGGEYLGAGGRTPISFGPASGASIKNQETISTGRYINNLVLSHFSIWTAYSGGQCLLAKALTQRIGTVGGPIRIDPGNLAITVN